MTQDSRSLLRHWTAPGVDLYRGDCREVLADGLQGGMPKAVLVTDPPYGINYQSGARRATLPNSIEGDKDTSLRDWILELWGDEPALVFGSWKMPRPVGTRMRLIWDTKGANGMGDLSVPWKPTDQEIYVLGKGFTGRRDSNVLCVAPVQSTAKNGRLHPHEKPVNLMRLLIAKCPADWLIVDPCMGSGSTIVAAVELGRRAVGIELDPDHYGMAVQRTQAALGRSPLFVPEAAA